jgi:hypothetical protein
MSAKQKRVVITIEQKLEAVRWIKNGEILRSVAVDFGVHISDWLKSKLEEHSSKMPNGGSLQPKKTLWKKVQTKI